MKSKRFVAIVLALSAIGLATGCGPSLVTAGEPVETEEAAVLPSGQVTSDSDIAIAPAQVPTEERENTLVPETEEEGSGEEPLPLLQRYERPRDLASSIKPLEPEVPEQRIYDNTPDEYAMLPLPLSRRYERPTDSASSIKTLDPAPADDEALRCNPIPGGLFRCSQGTESFCATLLGERRECPAADPVCEPITGAAGIDRCREEGGSMSWCQATGSSERVKCPAVRTGPFHEGNCMAFDGYLRCFHYTHKLIGFCADQETGERILCPQEAGVACSPLDEYQRRYSCEEGNVTWCISGKPVQDDIYDPTVCPGADTDVRGRGESMIQSP